MAHTNAEPEKETRVSIRTNSNQKAALARAAKARHMNISQFVLQASLSAAEQVIEQETRIVVSPEEYEWLCQVMDAPATPAPRLRTALSEKLVWDV